MKRLLLLMLSAVLPISAQSWKTSRGYNAVDIPTLKRHVYTLADDDMGGRGTGEAGYGMAVTYVEKELKSMGLSVWKPYLNGYRQGLPFWRAAEDDSGHIELSLSGQTRHFIQGRDFKFDQFENPALLDRACQLVFVGYGIERGDYSDYRGLDLKGKVAVMHSRVPTEDSGLPDSLVALYKGGRRSHQRLRAAADHGAVAVIRLADDWTNKYWKTFGDVLMDRSMRYLGEGDDEVAATHVTVGEAMKNALMQGSLDGASVRFTPGKKSGLMRVPNVVALVPGSDAELKNEFVVVGAHLDHVGIRHGEICNGADDNASGVACLLEVADAVRQSPPRRSIVFVAFAAEEIGLLGSKYFVNQLPVEAEQVKLMINLDMMGRTRSEEDSARTHIVYYSSDEVHDLIEAENEATVQWTLSLKRAGSTQSDHAAFMNAGIPAAFFFSGIHGDYHQPSDDADKIDYEKMQAMSRLVYAAVMTEASHK